MGHLLQMIDIMHDDLENHFFECYREGILISPCSHPLFFTEFAENLDECLTCCVQGGQNTAQILLFILTESSHHLIAFWNGKPRFFFLEDQGPRDAQRA